MQKKPSELKKGDRTGSYTLLEDAREPSKAELRFWKAASEHEDPEGEPFIPRTVARVRYDDGGTAFRGWDTEEPVTLEG